MKRTILLLLLISISTILNAQYIDDSYDWYPRQIGLKLGLNSTTLNSSKNQTAGISSQAESKFGYMANFSYWIPITQKFRPRIEVSFDVLNSEVGFIKTSKNGSSYSFNGETRLTQGSIAILPELVFGKNIQFSIFAGFQISALISAHEKGTATTTDSLATLSSVLIIDQKNNTIGEDVDSGFLTGFGARYRLSKKLFFNAETRFRFGTSMVYDIYKPYYWGISAGLIYQL